LIGTIVLNLDTEGLRETTKKRRMMRRKMRRKGGRREDEEEWIEEDDMKASVSENNGMCGAKGLPSESVTFTCDANLISFPNSCHTFPIACGRGETCWGIR
jgi:hypothetical protein